MNKNPNLLSYLLLIFAMFLWASTFIALKLAFKIYDPMVVIFGRMMVASLCVFFFPKVLKNVKLRAKDLKLLAIMVICEPCFYFVFEAKALVYTSAAQAGMITTMMPLLTAIGAWLILKEDISIKTGIGFAVSVSGALWLSFVSSSSEHGSNPLLGNFLEFMAMVCATGYALCLKKLTERYSPWFLTFMQAFSGALFFFPVLFFPGTTLPTQFEPVPVLAVLYLGAGVTLGAYGLYSLGVSRIPASQATAFINLIPVFTLIMSSIVLGERFTGIQYMASFIVFFGVVLTQGGPIKIKRKKVAVGS